MAWLKPSSSRGRYRSLRLGPTATGASVAMAAQKVQKRRSLRAWRTQLREMNFMRASFPPGRATCHRRRLKRCSENGVRRTRKIPNRSEEHTSELQSPKDLVCRLLLEKKKDLE